MGSDEWETDAWKEGQKKEQERVKKLNEETRAKLKKYFIKKLESLGCPDSYLDRTAESMTKKTIEVLNWKGEEVCKFYR
jgi:uncharacterized tellurite resistance protein B-like protein